MTDTIRIDARAEAESAIDDVPQLTDARLGEEYFDRLGEFASADTFWDVVVPMVSAIGAVDPVDAGFAEAKNVETALEVLLEVVRIRRARGEMH